MPGPVFDCPSCHVVLRPKVAPGAGQRIKCPRCGAIFDPSGAPTSGVTVNVTGSLPPEVPRPAPSDSPSLTSPGEDLADDGSSIGVDPELTRTQAREVEVETVEAQPPPELHGFLAPPQEPDELGRLGQYRVLKVLGQGGMGMVYQAEDVQLRRQVAIKAMLPQLASNPRASSRFQREARAAAAIEHDHIISIFNVGDERGIPYLAMPLLKGESLAARLRRQPHPAVLEVLRIGREIAEGLAAAHERGLIHRDIKPANVWLEGQPGANVGGRVKILDFGLAREVREEDTLPDATTPGSTDQEVTLQGTIVGTPAYMAPEQASGKEVDSRCDLFSLGCVLYLMSTGELPFSGKNVLATLKAVATHRPIEPRELNPAVPRELSELVMDLLAKDPAQRPASAQVVARQLRALAHEERARVARARARRWWLAMGTGLALLAAFLTAALVISLTTPQGMVFIESDDPRALVSIMKDGVVALDHAAPGMHTLHAGPYKVELLEPRNSDLVVNPPTFTLERDGRVFIRIKRDSDEVGPPIARVGPPPPCAADALKRDDLSEAALANFGQGDPRAAPAELVAVLGDPRFRITGVSRFPAFSPDGTLLAVPSGAEVRVFAASTGACRKVFHSDTWRVFAVAFSADSSTLAAACGNGNVVLWDVKTGQKLHVLVGHHEWAGKLAFAPQGHVLASASADGTVRVWDCVRGQQLHFLRAPSYHWMQSVAFSKDGKWLAATCSDGKAYLWETNAYALKHALVHEEVPAKIAGANELGVAFSPDGKVFATGSVDGLRIWDAHTLASPAVRQIHQRDAAANWLAFSPDSATLFSGSRHLVNADNTVGRWDVATGNEIMSGRVDISRSWAGYALSPDGKTIAALGEIDRVVQMFDAQTCEARIPDVGHRREVWDLAFSPDGRSLAAGSVENMARIWDLATGKPRMPPFKGHTWAVWSVAYSPDGKLLATGAGDGTIRLWEAETGKLAKVLRGHAFDQSHIAFSPDGRRIAAGTLAGSIRLWNVRTGAVAKTFPAWHRGNIRGVAFSPDGSRLASVGADGAIIISDASSGGQLARTTFLQQTTGARVQFSPDGTMIAAGWASPQPSARLWKPHTKEVINLTGHANHVTGLAFRPDGRLLATAAMDDSLRLWEVGARSPRKLVLAMGCFGRPLNSVAFSPDGRYLATGNPDGTIALFRLAAPADNVGDWLQAMGGPPRWGLTHEEWLKAVARLSAGNLVQAVSDRLCELNPGFDGAVQPSIEDGAVAGLTFATTKVTNLLPLSAVKTLRRLDCSGKFQSRNGLLRDLSPLRGLPLEKLIAHDNQIQDLAPLAGMPLKELTIHFNPLADLAPLKGVPLEILDIGETEVQSLAPLRGMRLLHLRMWRAPVADLSPLRGMPLNHLELSFTKVASLAPLADSQVQYLGSRDLPGNEFMHLAKLPLEEIIDARSDPVPPVLPALDRLRQFKVDCKLTNQDAKDKVRTKSAHKAHAINLIAGNTYTFDMTGTLPGLQFDPYLRLEDAAGNQLAFDDDSGGGQNARIVFRCTRSGLYRIIATTFQPGFGYYSLSVTVGEVGETKPPPAVAP
jgi:WD40 repeat protein